MMNFGNQPDTQTNSYEAIPHGALLWAVLEVRGLQGSKAGGQYLDTVLTIDEGQPYQRRKIFEIIMDPMFENNSEAARQMGYIAIRRILEAGAGANPNNPEAYNIASYDQLNGLRVPIRIKIEKSQGYEDKNRVAEWLTPNPDSSGFAGYKRLCDGDHNLKTQTNQAPAQPVANQRQSVQPQGEQQAAPSWLGGQQSNTPTPAAPQQPTWGNPGIEGKDEIPF